MPRQPTIRVTLAMPKAWAQMADQLSLLTSQSRGRYCLDALIRQMMADWATTPGRGFWLRPATIVYRKDGEVFVPVATSLGGERVWPLENIGTLPASLGGGLAFRADIVPVGMTTGLQMADAIVPRDRFGGPAT